MLAENGRDSEKIAELTAIVQAVRERVRKKYPMPGETTGPQVTSSTGASGGGFEPVRVQVADLMPIVHARDAAQAKIAAIGGVNPRAGGVVNRAIQGMKKSIARGLQWFVRDQITFNHETVTAVETILEALNEHNQALGALAGQINGRQQAYAGEFQQVRGALDVRSAEILAALDARTQELRTEVQRLEPEIQELRDIRNHFGELRTAWEQRIATNEIQFLRSVADLQGAFQHRVTQMESNFRDIVKAQHADYLGALDRATAAIQKELWADLEKVRAEYSRLIHEELRVIRLRYRAGSAPPETRVQPAAMEPPIHLDYARFAYRFRGSEEYVRRNEAFYRPFFSNCHSVLDIGCGRGEFLELMRDMGVPARGIDLGAESVAQCEEKGLTAEVADLFAYLGPDSAAEFDGIFASQIVEHVDPAKLPEMIRLCAESLRRGGVLAVETPNPECLAIFATHFYLDPTHARPVPSSLLRFYMEEAGIGSIEVHELSPAIESIPEIAELPESFRKRFFGGLDYAIIGRKL